MEPNQEMLFSMMYIIPMIALIVASGMCILAPAVARRMIGFSRLKDGYMLLILSVMPIINLVVLGFYLHYRTFK